MLHVQLVLSILYVCIICGAVSVIAINLILFALGKAFDFDEEFELMDDDCILTKDGEKIPYDEDIQE